MAQRKSPATSCRSVAEIRIGRSQRLPLPLRRIHVSPLFDKKWIRRGFSPSMDKIRHLAPTRYLRIFPQSRITRQDPHVKNIETSEKPNRGNTVPISAVRGIQKASTFSRESFIY